MSPSICPTAAEGATFGARVVVAIMTNGFVAGGAVGAIPALVAVPVIVGLAEAS